MATKDQGMNAQNTLHKRSRRFYPESLTLSRWGTIKQEFLHLLNMPINCHQDLILLIEKSGEGMQILLDHRNRLFIDMISRGSILAYLRYLFFQKRIISRGLRFNNQWEIKVEHSPFKPFLNAKYAHLFRLISHQRKMYVSKNDRLLAQDETLGSRYLHISGRLGARFDGRYHTVTALDRRLYDENRSIRKETFITTEQLYQAQNQRLDGLLSRLVELRHTIATHAGFANYRDYAHEAKARFSYRIEDVLKFHQVVEREVVPLLKAINKDIQIKHGLKDLMPWDAKLEAQSCRCPYSDEKDLLEKACRVLGELKPEYGTHFAQLVSSGFIDLFNRKKKSQGAYNIPLFEVGASYIFANFSRERPCYQDVAILYHEFGHALHNYMIRHEPIMTYRNLPSEIAELAAMTMELITLEHLRSYFPDTKSQDASKKQQLRRFLQLIVSRCQGDAFQHWLYTHPEHTVDQRKQAYIKTMNRFDQGVSWDGFEKYQGQQYLKVHHFFQVPFYYIEYAFAALGALDLYRQYQRDPDQTLQKYERFLSLGYSKDVHLLYEEAGTPFDFSDKRVRECMDFVRHQFTK